MILELYWSEIRILNIKRLDGLYYTTVESQNIPKVKNCDFPLFFLKDIRVVSEDLPYIVKKRLFDAQEIKDKISNDKNYSQNEFERDILEYINTTECRKPTDKFSIKIEI